MSQNTENNKVRLAVVYFCVLLAFLAVLIRMFVVIFAGDKGKIIQTYDLQEGSERGSIFDRNGLLVASDIKTKSLYVSSILVRNPKDIANRLAPLFDDLSEKDILDRISKDKKSNNKKWILIKRNLTPTQVESVQKLQKAGLIFEDDLIRIYPQKSNVAHFIGYVDPDRKGLSGIELAYNQELEQQIDIISSLDIGVQDIVRDELENGIEEFGAKAATAIVMDVNNGEVISMVSLPDFDPNVQSEADANSRFNRSTSGVYEMGSVFKIFTCAMALEENLFEFNDNFNVSEPIRYGRFTINDDHKVKDVLTFKEVFAHSSNIGTIKIAEKIGVEKQKYYLKQFGLLDKLQTNFPGLGKPLYPRTWREINLFTIAYGHGIAVSPLHIATAVSAIVNGGFLYQPSFVKTNNPSAKKVLSDAASQKMRELMKFTATQGTGKKADILGYDVGGKTGTAERAEYGGYNRNQTMTSFVATFPISQPKYLVLVVFDRPDYMFNTGGMVSAPVAGRIIKNIAPILGIKPDEDDRTRLIDNAE